MPVYYLALPLLRKDTLEALILQRKRYLRITTQYKL